MATPRLFESTQTLENLLIGAKEENQGLTENDDNRGNIAAISAPKPNAISKNGKLWRTMQVINEKTGRQNQRM